VSECTETLKGVCASHGKFVFDVAGDLVFGILEFCAVLVY
jgi:hypothetical protein